MQSLERAALIFVLNRVLSRACPSTVHRSGTEGEQVNCFTTTYSETDDPYMVLLSRTGDQVSGLEFDGQNYKTPKTVPLDAINPKRLAVTHYYGLDEVAYQGAPDVAMGLVLGWPYGKIRLHRLSGRLRQRLFNTRSLPVRQRLEILRDVLAASEGRTDGVGALDLMSHRHGYQWAGHPDWKAHHDVLEFHLELLSDSGELRKAHDGYRPTGLALKTLEESEEQDRKHSANIRVQVLLALLAVVTSAGAVVQAGLVKLPTVVDWTDNAKKEGLEPAVAATPEVGKPAPPSRVATPAAVPPSSTASSASAATASSPGQRTASEATRR